MLTFVLFVLAFTWFCRDAYQRFIYNQLLSQIPLRIHVNGIRGKSSLTRYISAILRHVGYKVYAKTTGTSARIIDENGGELIIKRFGRANISEQIKIMSFFVRQQPDAVVVECMAVNPLYSHFLETKVMNSNIYIFSNVYLDHVDQLGNTLEEIAESLSIGFPRKSIIITSESKKDIISLLHEKAALRESRLVDANLVSYSLQDVNSFGHVPIEENIKICLSLASILQIPRHTVIDAIKHCNLDEGQFSVTPVPYPYQEVHFANLFAINDIDTFEEKVFELLNVYPSYQCCVVLNNRNDRTERIPLFLDAVINLGIVHIVSLGECGAYLESLCYKKDLHLIRLDQAIPGAKDLSGRSLLNCIVESIPGFNNILIIGSVNIHTSQAHNLLGYIGGL